jgi:hypothetical protein
MFLNGTRTALRVNLSCGKMEKKTKIIANFEELHCWTGILRMQFPTPYGIALLKENGPEL